MNNRYGPQNKPYFGNINDLIVEEDLQKGRALPVGTVRTWGGVDYIKHADGWVEVRSGKVTQGKKMEVVHGHANAADHAVFAQKHINANKDKTIAENQKKIDEHPVKTETERNKPNAQAPEKKKEWTPKESAEGYRGHSPERLLGYARDHEGLAGEYRKSGHDKIADFHQETANHIMAMHHEATQSTPQGRVSQKLSGMDTPALQEAAKRLGINSDRNAGQLREAITSHVRDYPEKEKLVDKPGNIKKQPHDESTKDTPEYDARKYDKQAKKIKEELDQTKAEYEQKFGEKPPEGKSDEQAAHDKIKSKVKSKIKDKKVHEDIAKITDEKSALEFVKYKLGISPKADWHGNSGIYFDDRYGQKSISIEIDRFRRHDHGGGRDGDDWLDGEEINKDFELGAKKHKGKLDQVKAKLKEMKVDGKVEFNLGEKGHFSIDVDINTGNHWTDKVKSLSDEERSHVHVVHPESGKRYTDIQPKTNGWGGYSVKGEDGKQYNMDSSSDYHLVHKDEKGPKIKAKEESGQKIMTMKNSNNA